MADSLNLSKVGLSNSSYSAAEEALIQQALIATERPCIIAEQARIAAEEKLAELIEQVARYKIALAPHKRLPEDLLREIFNFVCHGQILYLDRGNRHNVIIRLSRVCSAWRRIALNMPHLWADVNIYIYWIRDVESDDVKAHNEDCNLRLARLWLARGGFVPRSLYVTCSSFYAVTPHVHPFRIQQSVESVPYGTLHLQLCWTEMDLALRGITPKQMLPLESWNLRTNKPHHGNSSLHLPLPTKLPSLTHLVLDECFQGNILSQLCLGTSWSTLSFGSPYLPQHVSVSS